MLSQTELKYVAKYATIGVGNTLLSFIIYYALLACSINPDASNAISYLVGIVNSFLWNKFWTFKTPAKNLWHEAAGFFLCAFVCWVAQWLVFRLCLWWTNAYWAYVVAFPVYPVLNYLLNRLFIFHPNKTN
ncbi:MAG: GtrA family protein [Alloprevotella sp.]|nr:GtrA family protein [Alloprevotella sp.]